MAIGSLNKMEGMKTNMKKDFKNIMIGFLAGAILFGSFGVAAITLTAKEITYTPSDSSFDVSNTETAINKLYEMAKNGSSTGTGLVVFGGMDAYRTVSAVLQAGTYQVWGVAKTYAKYTGAAHISYGSSTISVQGDYYDETQINVINTTFTLSEPTTVTASALGGGNHNMNFSIIGCYKIS